MDKLHEGMLKFTFCKFPMIFFVITIHVAIILTPCNGKTLELIEGDTTDLDFPFPCESSNATLRISNRIPFFSLKNPILYSRSPRYSIYILIDNENRECSIHLTINPVTREDQGVCILTVYIDGDFSDEYTQRIGLMVAYPPGPTSCELREGFEVGEWVALQCTAFVGTLPGQMECHQGGIRSPPQSALLKTNGILQQTFWVMNNSYPTFCCTSASDQPKEKCECKEFVWDLSNKTQSNITKDPCPTGQVQINSTSYHTTENISAIDPTQIATDEGTQTEQCKTITHSKSQRLILCIVIPVSVLSVIILAWISWRKHNVHKKRRPELQSNGNKDCSKAYYIEAQTVTDDEGFPQDEL